MPLSQFEEPSQKKKIHTVSELARKIKRLIDDNFRFVWVCGEVSNLTYHQNGHVYFDLKDSETKIRAVIWRGVAAKLKFRIEEGMELVCGGPVTLYDSKFGTVVELIAEVIEPKGTGALQLAFEQLKAKLQKEGLFNEARKKPIPMLPRTVGIVTSPTGAAIQDMLRVIHNRFPKKHVLIYPVRVQGEGAAEEIAEAIYRLNMRGGLDVMIVGRGGGSIEDLWAFNEEVVARAIAASRIPVISAVGHETDVTISDWVADRRALTPTNAAEIVTTPAYDDMVAHLDQMRARLTEAIRNDAALLRSQLDSYRSGYAFEQPRHTYEKYIQRMQELDQTMQTHILRRRDAMRSRLNVFREQLTPKTLGAMVRHQKSTMDQHRERVILSATNMMMYRRERLKKLAELLNTLSPLNVLQRGYSITLDAKTGRVIQRAAEVRAGDLLQTRLSDGWITSRVEPVRPESVSVKKDDPTQKEPDESRKGLSQKENDRNK